MRACVHARCIYACASQHAMVATCGVERHIDWWSPSISRPVVTLYGHAAAVTQVRGCMNVMYMCMCVHAGARNLVLYMCIYSNAHTIYSLYVTGSK